MRSWLFSLLLLAILLVEAWLLLRATLQHRPTHEFGDSQPPSSDRSKPSDNRSQNDVGPGGGLSKGSPDVGATDKGEDGRDPDSDYGDERHPKFNFALKREIVADPSLWIVRARQIRDIVDATEREMYAQALMNALDVFSREEVKKMLPPVEEALSRVRSETPEERQVWAYAAHGYDSAVLQDIIVDLATADPDPLTRSTALISISLMRAEPRAAEILMRAADSDDFRCRNAAIDGLGRVGGPEVVPVIENAAASHDFQLRHIAWGSLCDRASADAPAFAALRRIIASDLDSGEAGVLWAEISGANLVSKLSREEIVRLETQMGSR